MDATQVGIESEDFEVDFETEDACELADAVFAGEVGAITSDVADVVVVCEEVDVFAVDIVDCVVVVTGSRYSTCNRGAAVGLPS